MNRETTVVSRAALARQATEALERLAGAAERERDRHAGAYGLSDAKLEVLEVLCCRDERRACLHHLGEELGVTRPNVTKLVDGLERGGLVERRPHPRDGRMIHAQITSRGIALADEALPGRAELMGRLWDALSDEELDQLVGLLARVGGARDEPAPRDPGPPAHG